MVSTSEMPNYRLKLAKAIKRNELFFLVNKITLHSSK